MGSDDGLSLRCFCFAAAVHAAVLLAGWRAVPPLGATEGGPIPGGEMVALQPISLAAAELEEDLEPVRKAESLADGKERIDSRCGEDRGGSMGEPVAARTGLRYGVMGPADNADPHVAHETGHAEPLFVPMVGPSTVPWGGSPAPSMPWGRFDALGNDAESARGNLWGDAIGLAFGSPGAGIGREKLCPTCGGSGLGAASRIDLDTARGGATSTERAAGLL